MRKASSIMAGAAALLSALCPQAEAASAGPTGLSAIASGYSISVIVPAPGGFTGTWTGTVVQLSWNAVANCYYEVWRAPPAGGDYVLWYIVYYGESYVGSGPGGSYQVRAIDYMGTAGAFAGPVLVRDPVTIPLGNGLPESDHPYANNSSKDWTYSGPSGAVALNVTFDARTATESGWDTIALLDGAGNPVSGSPFSGSQLSGRTVQIPGAAFSIRFRSDYSVTDWGLAITTVTALLPPLPAAPYALKPAANGVVSGPLLLAWSEVGGAAYYQVELSSDGSAWSQTRTGATSFSSDLGAGQWSWRVRAGNNRGLGAPSPAVAFSLVAGFRAAVEHSQGTSYRVSLTAYRSPPESPLSVSGLPTGTSWAFFPPRAPSAGGQSALTVAGAPWGTRPGDYPFTVLAGGVPLEGGQGVYTVAVGPEISEAHAYPNPSADGRVRIKAVLSRSPDLLKVKVYDLSGAVIWEAQESAPFTRFQQSAPGVYEIVWEGGAGGKYLFRLEAKGAGGETSLKGLITVTRR